MSETNKPNGWASVWDAIRKWRSPEQVTRRVRDEVKAAKVAETARRARSAMPHLAKLIERDELHLLSAAVKKEVADFLRNSHRGARGHKRSLGDDRQVDLDRAIKLCDLINSGMNEKSAMAELERREKIDMRSLERSLDRAANYFEEDRKVLNEMLAARKEKIERLQARITLLNFEKKNDA